MKGESEIKIIKISPDNICLFQFMNLYVTKNSNGSYICNNEITEINIPYVPIEFNINQSYEIFDYIKNFWGGWNQCPDSSKMKSIAEKWERLYSVEIESLCYDSISFRCREKLNKSVAESLISEIMEIAPDSLYIYNEKELLEKQILEIQEFRLWWD